MGSDKYIGQSKNGKVENSHKRRTVGQKKAASILNKNAVYLRLALNGALISHIYSLDFLRGHFSLYLRNSRGLYLPRNTYNTIYNVWYLNRLSRPKVS